MRAPSRGRTASSRALPAASATLLKKAQVRSLRGAATLVDGKTVIVHADTGEQRIRCEHLILATGSDARAARRAAVRRRYPFFDRGAGADRVAKIARRRRRRLHRARARHGLRQVRRESDHRRSARSHPAALRRRADAAGGAKAGIFWRRRPPQCACERAFERARSASNSPTARKRASKPKKFSSRSAGVREREVLDSSGST